MPSYLSYMRQMAVLDADDTEIESWITVKGNHIPIKKGQSKEDAVKEFISKKSDKEFSKRAEKPQSIGEATKKVVSQVKENREINKAAKKEYPAEFETVRKNAKANPYLYDLRYTQKSKAKAYEEYKKDTEKEQGVSSGSKQTFYKNTSGKQIGSPKGWTFIENEIMTEKEMARRGFDPTDKRFERKELGKNEHHFSFGARFENAKSESKKEEPHYFHKWTIEAEKPHNLKTDDIKEKLNFYRAVRSNGRSDDNELLDKIHDLSDELERRKK